MPQSLKSQTALVTGAASGIGAGVARALGAAGAAVVINYVTNPAAAEAVAAEIRAGGAEATALQADVSSELEVREMFAKAIAHFGAIDILVNNAGLQQDAPLVDMTLARWNKVIGVNLTGMFLCAREAAREMIRRGVRAEELAPHRIRVNSVAPGAIQTPINRAAWETPEALASLLRLIPYGRIGQPEDIGRVVAWLASDDADYIHGQTIFVDGGMTLYPEFARGG